MFVQIPLLSLKILKLEETNLPNQIHFLKNYNLVNLFPQGLEFSEWSGRVRHDSE